MYQMHSIELISNTRLMLAKINRIKIDFNSDYQTIIGTNGSGKSTILRESSPLPPISSDYLKGGSKTVHFSTDDGEQYTAFSENKNGWLHSLIRMSDGVELNPGKTRQVQRQLIQSLCGLTEDLFDILVGDACFTQMAPNKRREWILSFSGSDLEYAMKIYRDLNKRFMDSVALQKHYAKRLATELEGMMGEDQLNDLRQSAKSCIERINVLLMERDGSVDPNARSQDIVGQLGRAMAEEESVFERIVNYQVVVPEGIGHDVNSEEDVTRIIKTIHNDIAYMQRSLDAAYGEHRELTKYMDALKQVGANGIDDIVKKSQELSEHRDKLLAQRTLPIDLNDPTRDRWTLQTILFELVELINQLPEDLSAYEAKGVQNNTDRNITLELIHTHQQHLKELDHQLYHMDKVDDVKCPQCTLVFAPGVDPELFEKLQREYSDVEKVIAQLEIRRGEYDIVAEEHQQHHHRLTRLNQHMSNHPNLLPLWNIIRSSMDSGESSMMINFHIHEYNRELELMVEYQSVEKELKTNEGLLRHAEAITQGQGDINTDRITGIDLRIKEIMRDIDDARRHVTAIETFGQAVQELDHLNEHYARTMDQIWALSMSYQLTLRNECLDEDIAHLQSQLAVTQASLSDATTAAALIDELRRNKKMADDDVIVHKALVDGLSPTNGLIANNIRSFIDGFVDLMNQVIAEVWTYPMRIIGCDIDAAVDCKFPLESEGESSGGTITVNSPDISKSSSAQTDIINFAFRYAAMICLGFKTLYLDEAGVRMDEKHRDRFNGFIERIMECKQVTQAFMISHYAAMHGVFVNADVTVVDKSNIIHLPVEYNKFATLEYME